MEKRQPSGWDDESRAVEAYLEGFVTQGQACQMLSVTRQRLDQYRAKGRLRRIATPGGYLYDRASVLAARDEAAAVRLREAQKRREERRASPTKVCSRCGVEKEKEGNFTIATGKYTDGYQPVCRECHSTYYKKRWIDPETREKMRERNRGYYRKMREEEPEKYRKYLERQRVQSRQHYQKAKAALAFVREAEELATKAYG